MKKKNILFLSLSSALLTGAFLVGETKTSADSFDDTISQKQQGINQTKQEITKIDQQKQQLTKELTTIHTQMTSVATTLNTAEEKLNVLKENHHLFSTNQEETLKITGLLAQVKQPIKLQDKKEEEKNFKKVLEEQEKELSQLKEQVETLKQQKITKLENTSSLSRKQVDLQTKVAALTKEIATVKEKKAAYYSVEGIRNRLVDGAFQQLGKPYVWGSRGPSSFDCSGLMLYLYNNIAHRQIGNWSGEQQYAGRQVPVSQAEKGDILVWGSNGHTTHVAMYIGNGNYIHAPQTGDVVKVSSLASYTPNFAVKVL